MVQITNQCMRRWLLVVDYQSAIVLYGSAQRRGCGAGVYPPPLGREGQLITLFEQLRPAPPLTAQLSPESCEKAPLKGVQEE
jgi:hypothetical protein